MKDFVNPFENLTLRAKPWFQLRPEETSYIIYNAYRLHFLKSEDVQHYVRLHRLQQVTYWAFPLIAFPAFQQFFQSRRLQYRRFNNQLSSLWSLAGTAVAWWAFSKLSPFHRAYNKEKLKVLNYLDANLSLTMLNFNNLLPRHWTENWVNGYTAQLYRHRNSWLTGIVYAPEAVTSTIISEDEFPQSSQAMY